MAGKGSVVIKIDGDASGFEKVLGNVESKSKSVISGLGTFTSSVAKGITAAYGVISAAWSAVGLVSVKYNASIEQLQTSFATMTGSAEKAADVVERLRVMPAVELRKRGYNDVVERHGTCSSRAEALAAPCAVLAHAPA